MEDKTVLVSSSEVQHESTDCEAKKPNGVQKSGEKTERKEKKSSEARSQTRFISPVLGFSLIVCIGGVLGGYSHGFPSPTLLELEQAYERGERITAFPSDSILAGIFGVSTQPHSPPITVRNYYITSY